VVGQIPEPPPQTNGEQLGSPIDPAARSEQVPTEPWALQASQAPAQEVLQQTPSAQLPLAHWFAAEQVEPLLFLAKQAPAPQ